MVITSQGIIGLLVGAIGTLCTVYFRENFNSRLKQAHEFYMKWGNSLGDIQKRILTTWIPASQQMAEMTQLVADKNFICLPNDYKKRINIFMKSLNNLRTQRAETLAPIETAINQIFHGNSQGNCIARFSIIDLFA